jgi:hypothetical protein
MFVCVFVFHCHGNEIKISYMMADIGVRTIVRSCSILAADNLAALFTARRCLNTLGMETCRYIIE